MHKALSHFSESRKSLLKITEYILYIRTGLKAMLLSFRDDHHTIFIILFHAGESVEFYKSKKKIFR